MKQPIVVAIAIGVVLAACGSPAPSGSVVAISRPSNARVSPTPLPTPVQIPPQPTTAVGPLPATVLATIPYKAVGVGAGVNAYSTAFGFGSLWVPIDEAPHGWLLRIDATTNKLVARIPVGQSPGSVGIADRSVWVANDNGDGRTTFAGQNTLTRIDPATNRVVDTIEVEVGGPIAAGFGAIWVMGDQDGDGNGVLRRLNAETGRLTATFALSGEPVVSCDALWTIDTVIGTGTSEVSVVSQVDPKTGRRIHRWPIIAGGAGVPQDAAAGCVSIAVPEDNPLTSEIAAVSLQEGIESPGPTIPTPVQVVGGALWSVTPDGVVQAMDRLNQPTGTETKLPQPATDYGSWRFLHVEGAYWVVGQNGAFRVGLAP
jgi:hypothetical protein